jgi:hypothetical protein
MLNILAKDTHEGTGLWELPLDKWLTEANLVIDYLHHSTPEHLEMLGVDPTRLPTSDAWRERFSSTSSRCPWTTDSTSS